MEDHILSVKRNEFKYMLSYEQALRLKKEFDVLLQRDESSGMNGYRVKSLYFDSIKSLDFAAKISGDNFRKKVRLRIYGEEDETAKFEIKAKEGKYQQKSSLLLTRAEAMEIIKGNYGILLDHSEETAQKLYAILVLNCYRPSAMIEYNRTAYCYPEFDTRITFDSEVKSSELNFDLYSKQIPWNYIINEAVILEVKYNKKLVGFISDVLKRYQLNNISVSKYCSGRPLFESLIV